MDCRPTDTRREAILQAAADLFLERGFEGTTLDAVIERARGSRRAIYDHFGNKEGLLEAIVQSRCGGWRDSIAALDLDALDVRSKLVRIGCSLARNMLSDDGLKLYRLLVQECVRNPSLGRLMFESGVGPTQAIVRELLERESAAGRISIADPEYAAGVFVGIVKGDFHMRTLFCNDPPPTDAELERGVERGVDVFLNGVIQR